MNQTALLLAIVVFYQTLFALLSFRLSIKTGINPYVFKGEDAIQKLTEKVFRVQFLGLTAYLVGVVLYPELSLHTGPLPWLERLVPNSIGVTLTTIGASVAIIAQLQLGTSWRIGSARKQTALVTAGLFSYSRNPVFLGMILMLLGVTAAIPTAVTISLTATSILAIAVQVRVEEMHLHQILGEQYVKYCTDVPRWIRLRLKRPPSASDGPHVRNDSRN